MSRGWIGVDLDGTLAEYDGWQGIDHIGEPIPAMVNRVKDWVRTGQEVRIVTARVSGLPAERIAARQAIHNWCQQVFGRTFVVTNEKDFGMIELWDDRARMVQHNTGLTPVVIKTWG